jgi:hypothetical protein
MYKSFDQSGSYENNKVLIIERSMEGYISMHTKLRHEVHVTLLLFVPIIQVNYTCISSWELPFIFYFFILLHLFSNQGRFWLENKITEK